MRGDFLAAVLDTLLPGEGEASAAAALPSATGAGLDPAAYEAAHQDVLAAIAAAAGSEERFLAASPSARVEVLRMVERQQAHSFRALVLAILQDYYESEAVIAALGWRTDPPQPAGHPLAQADAATWERLERVKERGRLWR